MHHIPHEYRKEAKELRVSQKIVTKFAVDILNQALKYDPHGITRLFLHGRVKTNKLMADHPTIQVLEVDDEYEVGALGILNGILDVGGKGAIRFLYAKDIDQILKFEVVE